MIVCKLGDGHKDVPLINAENHIRQAAKYSPGLEVEVLRSDGSWTKGTIKEVKDGMIVCDLGTGEKEIRETAAEKYSADFNILVAPCVSPWGYETIQRWNAQAVDPNRSFNPNGEVVEGRSFNPEAATEESKAILGLLESLGVKQWLCHIDLHETTDTDESEFRPAKAARDGLEHKPGTIPDGFYLVSDSTNPQSDWHKAMIEGVQKITHIAPADEKGEIIDEKVVQEGVIAIPKPSSIGLCAGVTNALYASTTEVYPDSPKANEEQCNLAQVACISSGLDHLISVGAK